MSFPSSAVVTFLKAFNADRYEEIAYPKKVAAEFLIDERAIGEGVESAVIMFFAQANDLFFLNERFSAGKQIGVNP